MEDWEVARVWSGDGETIALMDLVDAWDRRVMRSIDVSPERDEVAWTEHDYIGALYLRDRLADALMSLESDQERAAALAALEPRDARFVAGTEPDGQLLVETCANVTAGPERWWWRRIPMSGPIRDEFEAWFERLSHLEA